LAILLNWTNLYCLQVLLQRPPASVLVLVLVFVLVLVLVLDFFLPPLVTVVLVDVGGAAGGAALVIAGVVTAGATGLVLKVFIALNTLLYALVTGSAPPDLDLDLDLDLDFRRPPIEGGVKVEDEVSILKPDSSPPVR